MTAPRTPLHPSSASQLAASALAAQGQYGVVTGLARKHDIRRQQVYDLRERGRMALQASIWTRSTCSSSRSMATGREAPGPSRWGSCVTNRGWSRRGWSRTRARGWVRVFSNVLAIHPGERRSVPRSVHDGQRGVPLGARSVPSDPRRGGASGEAAPRPPRNRRSLGQQVRVARGRMNIVIERYDRFEALRRQATNVLELTDRGSGRLRTCSEVTEVLTDIAAQMRQIEGSKRIGKVATYIGDRAAGLGKYLDHWAMGLQKVEEEVGGTKVVEAAVRAYQANLLVLRGGPVWNRTARAQELRAAVTQLLRARPPTGTTARPASTRTCSTSSTPGTPTS